MTQTPKETITTPESITDKKSVTCWETIQILFAPWRIPRIALRCSMSYASFVSSFALIWVIDVIIYGSISGVGEPYADWKSYFYVCVDRVFIAFIIQVAVLFVIIRLFTSLVSYVFQINPATIRAMLLTPIILIFPSHIWSLATMIVQVREPGFNFTIAKPEWIHWAIFTFLSEPCWLVIGLIALVGVGFVNAFRTSCKAEIFCGDSRPQCTPSFGDGVTRQIPPKAYRMVGCFLFLMGICALLSAIYFSLWL